MIINHEIYYPLYTDTEHFIILVTGGRGCEDPNQEIIMADLTTRKLKDVRVGDMVMGDDFTPRLVLNTCHGRSEMYRVHQTSAEDYFVNAEHVLTIKKSEACKNDKGNLTKDGTYRRPNGRYPGYSDVTDMGVLDYANQSKRFRENFRGYKVSSIPYSEQPVNIEPYMLGLWLGDGTATFPNITNADNEVYEWVQDYCKRHNLNCNGDFHNGAYHLRIVGDGSMGGNSFLNALKSYNLIDNKHIPQCYISNSESVRLELLAGLLDTDGSMAANGYEITQKNEKLARQIKFIADTLGFRTSINTKRAVCCGKDCGNVYRVHINGDVWRIPCKVERRIVQQENCHKNKDWHLSQLSIEPVGIGDWCGIQIDGNHRYLHADGTVTHNSGKSYGVATFIERLTFEMKRRGISDREADKIVHKILYTRYTMVSANISVIPEFAEKVEADGTQRYFRSTKTDIINKTTNSRIMFRGIKTSSGNQTAKLKSIHGITTFVCDEAEEWTSDREFETIAFSIRQPGIQNRIIIIMNPTDSNHFIYQKYIKDTHHIEYFDGVPVQISTHPNVLHIHTTYLDNAENLSEEFVKSAKEMKERDPERYGHIFMGRWADVAEGAVFKKWGIVSEFPSNAKNVAAGLDFGYTQDPTACIKCGVVGNDLYLDEQFYERGMLIPTIISKLKEVGCFVFADSADPRLIDEIALGGVIIYPVLKGSGSIIAGLEKMKAFDNIFVTKRSVNLQEELRNYTWAKDKDGNYINQPIDGWNHAIDASRYYVLGKLLGKILKPKNVRKSDLGIF